MTARKLDKSRGYAFTECGLDFYHGWHGGYFAEDEKGLVGISNVESLVYDLAKPGVRALLVEYALIKRDLERARH